MATLLMDGSESRQKIFDPAGLLARVAGDRECMREILMIFLLPHAFPQLPVFVNATTLLYRVNLAARVPGVMLIHMVGARIYPRPTWAGKAATFLQVLTVFAGVFGHATKMKLVPAPLLWVAAAFTLISGLQYLVQGMRFLNAAQAAEREESPERLFH